MNKDSYNYDMATEDHRMIRTFTGEESEDIILWIRDLRAVGWAMNWDSNTLMRKMILSLKGKALAWISEKVGNNEELSFESLVSQLKERFSAQEIEDKVLNRFLNLRLAASRSEFKMMVEDATRINEGGLINTQSLMKQFLIRCPPEMKACLFQASFRSWSEFIKAAEGAIWMTFPDRPIQSADLIPQACVVSAIKYPNKKKSKYNLVCILHGKGNHSTENCYDIQKLTKLGWKKPRDASINACEEDCSEENKNYFSYTGVVNKNLNNPFYETVSINNGKKHLGLIDTGADVSIINNENLPKNTDIIKSEIKVKATNGSPLKTIGKVENVEVKLDNSVKPIKMDAIINYGEPKYTIIGADTIMKNPEIMKNKMNQVKEKLAITKQRQIANIQLATEFLNKYSDIFKTEISELSMCNIGRHHINTGTNQAIFRRSLRIPIAHEKKVDMEIDKLCRLGILRPSCSPWSSRIVPVPKENGELRLCIDYRPLNDITVKDRYPLPRIQEIIDALSGASVFSILDATSGYYQIAVDENDIEKTAFAWKNGLYEFTRMPFGLCNGPASFQRIMDKVFKLDKWNFVIPYLDDIIVYSKNEEEHQNHLELVFGKLKAAGISLNKKKCNLFKNEIKILGYVVQSGNIVKMDPSKIEAINEIRKPETVSELRKFLGLANFGRDFIPKFSFISAPLDSMLKGEVKDSKRKLQWNEEAERAFINIKKAIVLHTERTIPDLNKKFILITDASNLAIGALLCQKDIDGKLRMISSYSKKLDNAQTNYSTTDKELLALVKSIEHYRHYLLGSRFELMTDHKALEYLKSVKDPAGRLLRWSLTLQEYDFIVNYIKGDTNVADIFSRPLVPIVAAISQEKYDKNTKDQILNQYHLSSGHGSSNNMKFLLKDKYQWKDLYKDIDEWVKRCSICNKSGLERRNTKNKVIETLSPNELWECDLIGPIMGNNGFNKYIFIAEDHYSKWIETAVIKDKEAGTVCECIKALIIQKHGIPNRILSDAGKEFYNETIKKLAERNSFSWEYSSPYHHNTLGAVERANYTLMEKLRKLSDFGKYKWENLLHIATNAMNISFNRSLNNSPYRIRLGKSPNFPIDQRLNIPEISFPIRQMREERDKNWQKYSEASITKGTIRISRDIPIATPVLIYREVISGKLNNKWVPGYKIQNYEGEDAYIVNNGKQTLRINKKHVKQDFSKLEEEMSIYDSCHISQ